MPEEKFLRGEPGVVSGQCCTARAGSGLLPTDPQSCHCPKPPATQPHISSSSSERGQTSKQTRGTPMAHQPVPIRWELEQAPCASTQ